MNSSINTGENVQDGIRARALILLPYMSFLRLEERTKNRKSNERPVYLPATPFLVNQFSGKAASGPLRRDCD